MIISLCGFMGCGKSSVGAALAESLGWPFVDLDAYIEHKMDRSIAEMFSLEGEEYFRAVELEALRDVVIMAAVTGEDRVLALGGGTPTIQDARRILREETTCVWLKASPETIAARLGEAPGGIRPLLACADPAARTRELLAERERYYALASHCIDTDSQCPASTAAAIKSMLGL